MHSISTQQEEQKSFLSYLCQIFLFNVHPQKLQTDFLLNYYLMLILTQKQILNVQKQLAKCPGPKLINYRPISTKQKQMKSTTPVFKQFVMSKLSEKQSKLLLTQVRQILFNENSNLQALCIILLKIVFEKQDNEDILHQIKAILYSPKLDLKTIKGVDNKCFTQKLSNKQLKKLISQFFDNLQYSNMFSKVEEQVKSSPVALQILVIFLRTILLQQKIQSAQNYQSSVSSQKAYQHILQVFDIYYTKKHNIYFFNDHGYFIQCGYKDSNDQQTNSLLFGNYFQNQKSYRQSIQELKQSIELVQSKKYSVEEEQKQKEKQKDKEKEKINPFHLIVPPRIEGEDSKSSKASSQKYHFISSSRSKSSLHLQEIQSGSNCDNPTPSFNQVSEDQLSIAMKQGNAFAVNLKTSETNFSCIPKNKSSILLNIVLKSSILDDTIPESQQNKLQHKTNSLGILLKGSAIINPKCNNLCKIHKSNPKIQNFDSPATNTSEQQQKQMQLRFRKFSQYNQNENKHVHLSQEQKKIMKRSQSQKNSLIIKEENQTIQDKKGLFGINCRQLKKSIQFEQIFGFGSQKPKKNQPSFTGGDHSFYSCACSVYKLKKNKLQSNVIQIAYKPELNFKKKGFFQHIQTSKQKDKKVKKAQNLSFLNNIQARKMDLYRRKNYSKNKSQHKSIDKSKKQKPLIKYSQFIVPRNLSKTPQKRSVSPKVIFSYKKNEPKKQMHSLSTTNKSFDLSAKRLNDNKFINPSSCFGFSPKIKSDKDKNLTKFDKSNYSSLKL